ncbi:RHS repeat-associated core domain-containing protein [Pseudomonas syringae pv. coryli]|uniref:RHS repeat-associated core domain-containing protein n=1 Tax=Pseudomonas syringae pv. coryli TaxID=317659 RepID=UPI000B317139|nr:RHS repeat-associated core domain-containing protein [Pseudomonas syringae pv. coryli]
MTSLDQTVLCTYRYDPLDRLASSSPVGQTDVQRFYQKNRLATEIEGALQRTVFQHEDLLLAQQRHVDGVVNTMLLATDQQRSVLRLVDKSGIEPVAYSAYGHHPAESGLTSLLGFNGERRDPVTGHYLLGNGYRAYNPVLMRFNSPDSLSPFDEGGLNAYGYCGGDPVGFVDPSGHGKFSVITEMAKRVLNRARPIEMVRAPPIKIKTPLSMLSEMVDRLPAISSSPSPIASSSAGISSRGIGNVTSANSTKKLNSLASSHGNKSAPSRPRKKKGGNQVGFASRDPIVLSARKKYRDALKSAGIQKPKPDNPVYINGRLETETFTTRIGYLEAKINYMSSIKGSAGFNRGTFYDQRSALRRERKNYIEYLKNPREEQASIRS